MCIRDSSRGYVKEELKKNNIPFFHSFVSNSAELVPLYQALDIYLITSREEGGPMGLIESMSCGVPVVTTKVGMAEDLIQVGIPGEISNEINSHSLAFKIEVILDTFYRNKKDSVNIICLLYTSPSPRDLSTSRMPSSA